ncbi:response regulator transcription factor [Paenibacillus nasutitermitis]|uniref:DNA-binding response regulator n=1 Tax=Paenibacillus nasutitermitis TaxID=1652958 RepID=A0A916Z8A3_9BACL|nr:response regulator [Paenibacillus nasutitermitis]GGD80062.1 DNA-binding response regulator [Paenibacillus nasutitermitis]
MWKVLLVEDELFVRESIKMIVNWEELGFTILGEADHGAEALRLLQEMHFDLVITDIKMPVMDGVELLKRARAHDLNCKFIMLSCLNEFEYVRQALEYGASNYILKLSMSVSSLVESLSKIKSELEVRNQFADQKINSYYGQIWRSINELDQDEHVPSVISELQHFNLTIVSVIRGEERWGAQEYKQALPFIQFRCTEATHLYHSDGLTTVFVWHKPGIVIVEAPAAYQKYAIVYATDIHHSKLNMQWKRLIQQLGSAWYEGTKGVFSVDDIEYKESAPYFAWRKKRELVSSFEKGEEKRCYELVDEIWMDMRNSHLTMIDAKRIAADVDYTLYSMIQKGSHNQSALFDARDHEELKQAMITKLHAYLEAYNQTQPAIITDHPEVNKVIAYINENFHKEISVKSMAALISMDENYFSSLFKTKTKESLITYVHHLRINKAMFYLTQTDLTINQISDQVGFNNINYFNRIFKRITGTTPSQYRY